ncbi:MAG: ATP-binding protein [Prosthecobacter sp.]
MNLRFAFGTVTYGRRISSLERVLDDIADAGYEGVEICQAPGLISGVESHANVQRLAEERDLKVLGYVGGTLARRKLFCGDSFDGYLVIDDWDPSTCELALSEGFKLALHPHVLHAIARVDDAKKFLAEFPKLLLLPDTGHMGINGENMMQLADNPLYLSRLAAVHLKDWQPQFGRHSHRYARGFVDLGSGDLEGEIVELLRKLAAPRHGEELWTVAEVDSSRSSERASAFACAQWLREAGFSMKDARPGGVISSIPAIAPAPRKCSWTPEQEIQFCHEVLNAASRDTTGFYQEIAEAFGRLLPCKVTEVRVYTPQLQGLELASWTGPNDWEPSPFIPVNPDEKTGLNLSHRAVQEQRCLSWDLPHPEFQRQELVLKHDLKQMFAIPVVNSWNAHHVRFLINLFPQNKLGKEQDPHFERIAEVVSRAADLMLDERCLLASGEMQYEKIAYQSSVQFFENLKDRVQEVLDCEGVAIFQLVRSRNRLELAATTGTEWRGDLKPSERHYANGDGSHTGNVWRDNRIFYNRYEPNDIPDRAKSWETVRTEHIDDCLMAPIARRGSGKPVLGVVRCRNRKSGMGRGPKMFTDDDAAALDALLQAALPQLELLLDQEFRQQSLRRLLHEFNVPNNAVRHCVQRIERDLKKQGRDPHACFSQDFLKDIWDYTELIGRQLQNADLYGVELREIRPNFEHTDLYTDVVAPAVNHVNGLLKLSNLDPHSIQYRLLGFPKLWVDRIQLQQVFFNLLANAIKYSDGPENFRVEITGGIDASRHFIVWFSDYGPGIQEEDRDRIFEPGWRSADAKEKNIAGHGLGLSIVRDIITAHGATIRLVRAHKPTRFAIALPFALVTGAPHCKSQN